MSKVNGSCLCGKLCFSAQLPTLWVAHCHCMLCQKNAGAAFVTWAGFNAHAVQIDDSLDRLPEMHVNWATHQAWLHLTNDLPKTS